MMTVPNLLTASRLLALPFIIALCRSGHSLGAVLVFVAAMLTDCIDGWLARRLNQTSRLGLYLDPVVDKAVVLTLFYELAAGRMLPTAIPHLFLVRELLQNGVRAAAATGGQIVGANWMGKTKAALQSTLLGFGLGMPWLADRMSPDTFMNLETLWRWACWAVLVLSWIFFGMFLFRNRGLLTSNRTESPPDSAERAA
jgi:CDP-diacylglycerol--glycerol-3-phosphate 3-phosphatidyltransferase